MPELPQFFVTRALERQGTAGPGPRYPEQPRIAVSDATLPARAFGQVGESAGTLGASLSKLAGALDRADDTLQYATALSQGLDALEATEAQITQDPTIGPRERHTAFKAAIDAQLQPLVQGLPPRAQAKFQLEIRPQVLARQRSLRVAGDKEFVETAQEGLSTVLATFNRQELSVTDPVALQALQASRTAVVEQFVQARVFSAGAGAALLHTSNDALDDAKFQRAIRAQPDVLTAHLTALTRGEAGIPGLPVPPPDKLPGLLDTAHKEYDAWLRREEHAELVATRKLRGTQDTTASQYRTRLYTPDITTQELAALYQEASTALGQGGLEEGDGREILSHIQALTDKRQEEQRRREQEGRSEARAAAAAQREIRRDAQDRTRGDAALLIEGAEKPEDFARAKDYVIAHKAQLSGTDMSTLLGRVNTRQDSTNYTNRDSYREGRDLIVGGALPGGGRVEVVMERLSPSLKVRLNTALDIYSQTMEQVHGKDGYRGVDQNARTEAQRVRDLYFPQGEEREGADAINPLRFLPQRPADLQGLAYPEALEKLETLPYPQPLKLQIFERLRLEDEQRQADERRREEQRQKPPPPPTLRQRLFGG